MDFLTEIEGVDIPVEAEKDVTGLYVPPSIYYHNARLGVSDVGNWWCSSKNVHEAPGDPWEQETREFANGATEDGMYRTSNL
jgi:hypothetical protein